MHLGEQPRTQPASQMGSCETRDAIFTRKQQLRTLFSREGRHWQALS